MLRVTDLHMHVYIQMGERDELLKLLIDHLEAQNGGGSQGEGGKAAHSHSGDAQGFMCAYLLCVRGVCACLLCVCFCAHVHIIYMYIHTYIHSYVYILYRDSPPYVHVCIHACMHTKTVSRILCVLRLV